MALAYTVLTVLFTIMFSFALVALRREGSTDQGLILTFSVMLLSLFGMIFCGTALLVGFVRSQLRRSEPPPSQPPWKVYHDQIGPQNVNHGGSTARPPQSPFGRECASRPKQPSSINHNGNGTGKENKTPSPRRQSRRVLWAFREEETE